MTTGFFFALLGLLPRDELHLRHPVEGVVAAAQRRLHVHVRALPDVALQDAGDQGGLFEAQVLRRFAEVQMSGRLHAIRTMAEVHLVAVHREDLFLRVPLLDLNRENRFLDLSRPPLLVLEEQLARQLLRQRAGARGLAALHQVLHGGEDDVGDAEAEVLEERIVLGGEDRVPEGRRNVLVPDDDAPLDREFANDVPARAVDARDRARGVVVERGDLREIAGEGEDHARDAPEHRRDQEEDDEARAPGYANDISSHVTAGAHLHAGRRARLDEEEALGASRGTARGGGDADRCGGGDADRWGGGGETDRCGGGEASRRSTRGASYARGAGFGWRGTAIVPGRAYSRGAYCTCGRARGTPSRTTGAGAGDSVLRGAVMTEGA